MSNPSIISDLTLIPNTVPEERLWFHTSSDWLHMPYTIFKSRFIYHSCVLLPFPVQINIDSPFGAAISFIPGSKHISIAACRKIGGKNIQWNSVLSEL